jgi:inosine/xanthosine triphosphatase
MLTIAVGSKNPSKIKAVEDAFKILLKRKPFKLLTYNSPSLVSKQPMNEKECIQGAYNRALDAINRSDVDIAVGLEAGISKITGKYFTGGWVVMIDKNNNVSKSATLKIQVPEKIMEMVKNKYQLGEATDMIYKKKDTSKKIGFFGLISDKLITRSSAYKDAVIAAYKYLFYAKNA